MNKYTIIEINPPIKTKSGFTITQTCDCNGNQTDINISTNKITKFKCRLCGHDEYEKIFPEMNGMTVIGGSVYPSSYMCKGCSVIFKDVDMFSDNTTKR